MTDPTGHLNVHTISTDEDSQLALDMFVEGLQPFHEPLYVRITNNEVIALVGYTSGEHEGKYELVVGGIIHHNGHPHKMSLSTKLTPGDMVDLAVRMLGLASGGSRMFRESEGIYAISAIVPSLELPEDTTIFYSHLVDSHFGEDTLPREHLAQLRKEFDRYVIKKGVANGIQKSAES